MLDDPAAMFTRVVNYLDCDSDPEIIASCVEHASFQALSGGREPGCEDKSSFFRKGIAGDWRNHLTEEQSAVMRQASSGLMDEFGYL